MNRCTAGVALTLALALSPGCERAAQVTPNNGVVRGRATLDGKPVPHATVTFTDPVTRIGVNAQTDASGAYAVKSYKDVGLPAGTYQVSVSAASNVSDEEVTRRMMDSDYKTTAPTTPQDVADALPAAYGSAATSGLTVTVVAGENPEFNFELKSRR